MNKTLPRRNVNAPITRQFFYFLNLAVVRTESYISRIDRSRGLNNMTQGRSIQVGDQVRIRIGLVGLEGYAGKVAIVTKIIPQLDGVLMIVSLIEDGTQLMVYEPPEKVDRIEQV